MAGRRQHHIPRFLQKGFASRVTGRQVYAFVYTKNRHVYESNTINIGVEKDFYGNPKETDTDDIITTRETTHSEFVDFLRVINKTEAVDSLKSTKLVGHILLRSNYLRVSTNEATDAFFNEFKERIKHEKNFSNILKNVIKNDRKLIAKKIKKALPDHLEQNQKILYTKYLLDNPSEWVNKVDNKYWDNFFYFLILFESHFPQFIKDAHTKALKVTDLADKFLNIGRSFTWRLVCSTNQNLILGDVPVIAQYKSSGSFNQALSFNDDLTCVYLPISFNKVLVGNKNDSEVAETNISIINEATAKLSINYFIASSKNLEFENISKKISLESSALTENDKISLFTKMDKLIQNPVLAD